MEIRNLFLISLLILVFKLSNQSPITMEPKQRCSQRSYYRCEPHHNSMSIWCDGTNHTGLPHPDTIGNTRAKVNLFKRLFVNRSCLLQIDKDILKHYDRLLVLDLADNFINKLQTGTFKSSTNLENLSLSNNSIETIEVGTFDGLIKLLYLDLGNNQLESLHRDTFHDLPKLEVLKINNNSLSTTPDALLKSLKSLKDLDLSGNNLPVFYAKYLKGLTNLKSLNLHSNQLTSLDGNIFFSAPNLVLIDLSNNYVTCLNDDVFADGDKLKAIYLAGNPLKTPQAKWFDGITESNLPADSTNILSTKGKWICDCKAYNYKNFLKFRNRDWKAVLDVQCSYPTSLEGKMLSQLNWKILRNHSSCDSPDEPILCQEEDDKTLHVVAPPVTQQVPSVRTQLNQKTTIAEITSTSNTQASTLSSKTAITSSSPVLPPEPQSIIELSLDQFIYVGIGVGIIVLFVIMTVVVVCITKQKKKNRNRNSSESSDRKMLPSTGEESSQSSRDDVIPSNGRLPTSFHEANSQPELYERDCGTGMSESSNPESLYRSQTQTQPKLVYNTANYQPPHMAPPPPHLVSGYFNHQSVPTPHLYASIPHHSASGPFVSNNDPSGYVLTPTNLYPAPPNIYQPPRHHVAYVPVIHNHQADQPVQLDPSYFTQPKHV